MKLNKKMRIMIKIDGGRVWLAKAVADVVETLVGGASGGGKGQRRPAWWWPTRCSRRRVQRLGHALENGREEKEREKSCAQILNQLRTSARAGRRS